MRQHGPSALDLIMLDRRLPVPVHRQLYDSVRALILDGRLKRHMRLPSTRQLASDLGISRNTVVSAFEALLADGYLEARGGSGTRVAALLAPPAVENGQHDGRSPPLSRRGEQMTSLVGEMPDLTPVPFRPGHPDTAEFPVSAWSRLLLKYARYGKDDVVGYRFPGGHPALKAAIAGHLAISRGVTCTADQIVIVSGTQAGLDLISRLLLDPGDEAWLEEPGYLGARDAVISAGGRPAPLFVRGDGWDFSRRATAPKLIFVTPSCQWPVGIVMSVDERTMLMDIAERQGAWVLEDDYDSEYRFRGPPIPAIQGGTGSSRVIYVGTFAKTLFPALRIGFVVVPPHLAAGVGRAVRITGQYPPLMLQRALADFIDEGYFSAHLRRMRLLYAERQKRFVELCRRQLSDWIEVTEPEGGMQVLARFRDEVDDRAISAAAAERGVVVQPLSVLYHHGRPEHGLLLGYAGLGREPTARAIAVLKEVLSASSRDHRRSAGG